MTLSIEQLLDETLAEHIKKWEDIFARVRRQEKNFIKGWKDGEPRKIKDSLSALSQNLGQCQSLHDDIQEGLRSFDYEVYCKDSFSDDFKRLCGARGIPVSGSYPLFEVFPFLVRVLPEEESVLINERRFRALRMERIVDEVERELSRLNRSKFNATHFIKCLAGAYDSLILQKQGQSTYRYQEMPVLLKEVYRVLTPMREWKKEYTIRHFSFDIHRLLKSGQMEFDGRVCDFGFVRDKRRSIRIVDSEGKEKYYGTVNFKRVESSGEGTYGS